MSLSMSTSSNDYDRTLQEFQDAYHSKCLFQNYPPVGNLQFYFSEDGVLKGEFICTEKHQGYDRIAHGGIIAAIIDASMAQCCMGHGLAAYTADLSIRYRTPLKILTPTMLVTQIVKKALGVLFTLECSISQEKVVHVEASGRFFKMPQNISSESI